MKTQLLIFPLIIVCLNLTGCEPREPGIGSGDDAYGFDLFFNFVNPNTGKSLFLSETYSPDSLIQWIYFKDGTKSGPWIFDYTQKNEIIIIGPIQYGIITGGLGELGTLMGDTNYELEAKLFFKNGDIDTIYSVVNCHNSCNYYDKTMQFYYNDKLVLDFDFRDEDADLMDLLLENNRYPYKDTVVFTIFKKPEF